MHIRNLNQALNQGLVLKKVIKFNKKAWVKSYVDVNKELRKKKRIFF